MRNCALARALLQQHVMVMEATRRGSQGRKSDSSTGVILGRKQSAVGRERGHFLTVELATVQGTHARLGGASQ